MDLFYLQSKEALAERTAVLREALARAGGIVVPGSDALTARLVEEAGFPPLLHRCRLRQHALRFPTGATTMNGVVGQLDRSAKPCPYLY